MSEVLGGGVVGVVIIKVYYIRVYFFIMFWVFLVFILNSIGDKVDWIIMKCNFRVMDF